MSDWSPGGAEDIGVWEPVRCPRCGHVLDNPVACTYCGQGVRDTEMNLYFDEELR